MEPNTKRLLYAVGATLILIGAIAYITTPKGLIKKADLSLSADQRLSFELQLQSAQKNVDEITKDMETDEIAKRYFTLGRTNANLGNYAEGEKYFDKAIATKKNFPLYLEYFNMLTAMHNYQKARNVARDALQIFPINIDLWHTLITLEKNQFNADTNKVEDLLLEAFEKSEHNFEIAADLGKFYEERGNIPEALNYWKIAAVTAPSVTFYADQVRRLESR